MTVRNRLLYNECIVLACLIVQVTFGAHKDLSSLDECDSSKERRIAELQEEIAAVRASLHATQRRILQYEDVNWQSDVTELRKSITFWNSLEGAQTDYTQLNSSIYFM